MKIRAFKEEDLAKMVNLINQHYQNSYEFIPFTEKTLLSEIRERRLQVLIAEENGEIRGLIVYASGPWGEEIEWLSVQSEDSQKLENLLVQEVEKLVKGDKVFTVVDVESSEIQKWIRRGYQVEGGLYHMIARLEFPRPIPSVTERAVLRSLRQGEEREIVELVNKAYGWERLRLESLERWMKHDPAFNLDWIHVAELDGKLVSVVVSRIDREYNEHFGGRRGYLGPAATLTEYQNKGFASALTVKAMNFLLSKGMECVALYTSETNKASVSLLKKLGFRITHHWKFLYKHFSKKPEPSS
jgi:ribosomal protein S18 acetylase RimI-like enzyme